MDLRERLLQRLAETGPPADLLAEARLGATRDVPPELRPTGPRRPAAVLVPVVNHGAEPGLLLTCRTDHLPDHPGQICFPGGSLESQDRDVTAAALRETREEIGVGSELIDVRGYLRPHLTITGFAVSPVVGLVAPDYVVSPDPHEVASVFEMPLAYALDPGNHHREYRSFAGHEIGFWVIQWSDYRIWGATAAMIVSLSRLIHEKESGNQ